jgi:glycosyltransferase involved in cell wall biosynthesis
MFTGGGLRNAGVSRYTRNLTGALIGSKTNSYVIFANSSVRQNPHKSADNAEFIRTRLPTSRTSTRVLWEQFSLPFHSAFRQLDVVHSFLNVSPLLSAAAQVVTIHDLSYLTTPWAHPLRRQIFLRIMSQRSAAIAGAVLADSSATKADISRIFRIPDEKIWVVYPGLEPDMRPVTSEDEVKRFRAKKGLPDRFILYLGTLEPRKNVHNLVRAFGRMRRTGVYDGDLVIAGAKGWGFQAVESAIEEENLGSEVHLVGYVDREEQPLWYNSAQVFAYPSAYEGFGIPALEAMACGTPVVTSSTSSLPEVVGDAGLTVEPDSVEAIADALAELVNSVSRREELRERGTARASRFSWEIAAARCLEAYEYALRIG